MGKQKRRRPKKSNANQDLRFAFTVLRWISTILGIMASIKKLTE
jgi:hypothetical protein